ncbi:MAG TPA: cation transporter [Acidimicrobiia bacterium]|nr:cation transporter [Acidimicrobiia bacterium]
MHDRELEAVPPDDLRAGVRVSLASIAWTIVASTIAVVAGIVGSSLVLIAFGVTGLLDAAGSTALVVHFRHALRDESFSDRHERMALQVVTLGLLSVGGVTAIESVRRLVVGDAGRAVPVGVAVSAASIVVLGALAMRKRRIAVRVRSRALAADGWLSATGCLLAVVTVAGTGLTGAYGWWQADPVAAAFVAFGAGAIGLVMRRRGVSTDI